MIIITPSAEILTPASELADIPKRIEIAGRVCYKSENKITPDSAERFCKALISRKHEAVLEHCSVTVKFIVDRGVSHEIVRHRMASYCQESTRYCRYDKDVVFIKPCFFEEETNEYRMWKAFCELSEGCYQSLLKTYDCSPEQARTVLPNSTKTKVVMTANIREWRHFFKLRTAKDAHPQMREVAIPLLEEFKKALPCLFEDIEVIA